MRFQLSIMKTVLAKPLRLLLLGAPGAGKGTQTSRVLKAVSGLNAISSGDLLRQEIQQHSKLGDIAQSYISEGKLVPDSFMVDLIHSNLSQRNWLEPQISWLLDGFPRTLNQAQELDKKLATYKAQINLVVELDVPEQVILNRIENRWVHIPSGRVYNLEYNPPKNPGLDDVTGEKLSKRADDNVETFKQRLATYHEQITPLKRFYQDQGVLETISGETSDIIFPQLLELIKVNYASH